MVYSGLQVDWKGFESLAIIDEGAATLPADII